MTAEVIEQVKAEGCPVWPENIVADRHEVTGKWVLWYLTDEQAGKCRAALEQSDTDTNAGVKAEPHKAEVVGALQNLMHWAHWANEKLGFGYEPVFPEWKQAKTALSTLSPADTGLADELAGALELLDKAHKALTWLCVREVHYDVDVRQAPNLNEAAWQEADAILKEISAALARYRAKGAA
jgi:hypothetical protein